MPTLTPQDFVSKWKRADARERQSVQEKKLTSTIYLLDRHFTKLNFAILGIFYGIKHLEYPLRNDKHCRNSL